MIGENQLAGRTQLFNIFCLPSPNTDASTKVDKKEKSTMNNVACKFVAFIQISNKKDNAGEKHELIKNAQKTEGEKSKTGRELTREALHKMAQRSF